MKPASGLSGLNEPVNGELPLAIGVVAWSSKTVFVKLSPLLPRPLLRMMSVAPWTRCRTRSPSNVCVRLPILTFTSWIGLLSVAWIVALAPAGALSGMLTGGPE